MTFEEEKKYREWERENIWKKPESSPCWLCSTVWKDKNRYDCPTTHITVNEENDFFLNMECSYSGMNEQIVIYHCPMCGAELKVENYKFGEEK